MVMVWKTKWNISFANIGFWNNVNIFPLTTLAASNASLNVYSSGPDNALRFLQYVKSDVGKPNEFGEIIELSDFDQPREDIFSFSNSNWNTVNVKSAVLDAQANNWTTIAFVFTGKGLGLRSYHSEIVRTGRIGPDYDPALVITTVPEPSFLMGLFSMAGSMLIMGYKRIKFN